MFLTFFLSLLGVYLNVPKLWLQVYKSPENQKSFNQYCYPIIFFQISAAIARLEELVRSAVNEVTTFCEEQDEWLVAIYKFASTWNDLEFEKWKSQTPRVIEEQLNIIKTWMEKAIFLFLNKCFGW